jgi:hypothetical protein
MAEMFEFPIDFMTPSKNTTKGQALLGINTSIRQKPYCLDNHPTVTRRG